MSDLPSLKEVSEDPKVRFQVELEFIQCLANPIYLNYLAQNDYLKLPEMVNYLAYLQYWKEPIYAKYIKYPYCLFMLDQLQHLEFRRELADLYFCKSIEDQMLLHWSSYLYRRNKIMHTHAQSVPLIKEAVAGGNSIAAESADITEAIVNSNSQNINSFNETSN